MENSNPFKIGDRFPEVTVLRRSAPKRSRRIIVVVGLFCLAIRGDFTPVCTTEFIAFEQWKEPFRKMNTELIGLSVDSIQ